jgi:CRISPR/Cas system-associated protein Cas5 (RAMP superfamily)
MRMLWIELIVLGFLLAGAILVGRSVGRRRREEEEGVRQNAELEKVLAIVADLKDEVDRSRARIEVLERLATDEERRVADEIEQLKRSPGAGPRGADDARP